MNSEMFGVPQSFMRNPKMVGHNGGELGSTLSPLQKQDILDRLPVLFCTTVLFLKH